jgi:RND family efflux transporter MFP subunit
MTQERRIGESTERRSIDGQLGDDRVAWREFAEPTTVEMFYRGWLTTQSRLIGGVGGGVVFGATTAGVQAVPPLAVWGDARRMLRALTEVAEQAVAQRRGVVGRHDVDASRRHAVAFPIRALDDVVGAVALDLAPRPEPELQAALRQLEWGASWLELRALRQTATRQRATQTRIQAALELVASAQQHDRFATAATAFVTELATRLGCDRVSLGFIDRGRARIRAMSHTADLPERTNLSRAIGAAMDEAIDQAATVAVAPPPTAEPRVSLAHEDLSRHAGGASVCTVPFARVDRIVGALTLERPAARPFDQATIEMVETVAGLAGPTLEALRRDDRWLTTKALDATKRTLAQLVGAGHLPVKLTALGVLAVTALLVFVKGEYRVSARGVMEAHVRRAAVAPFAGYLREAPVRAGDLVRRGQLLATLDDRDLRLERARLESQHDVYDRQRALAFAKSNAADINIARTQTEQVRARLALIDEQLAKARVVAEFDGVVVTGDLRQMLGSPVDKGQVLFEIAPLDAYRLVLEVDERDINDVASGQRGQLLLTASPVDPVSFTVEKLIPVSTAKDGRNFFRAEATLGRTPERLRPGMEGVAKIEIDRRPLYAVWLRSMLDWIRLALWTWSP